MGGRRRLAGGGFRLLPLTVTVAVLLGGSLRTCSEVSASRMNKSTLWLCDYPSNQVITTFVVQHNKHLHRIRQNMQKVRL